VVVPIPDAPVDYLSSADRVCVPHLLFVAFSVHLQAAQVS
jgi:hypothetical protein